MIICFSVAFRFGVENRNASKNQHLVKDRQKRMPKSTSASQITYKPRKPIPNLAQILILELLRILIFGVTYCCS